MADEGAGSRSTACPSEAAAPADGPGSEADQAVRGSGVADEGAGSRSTACPSEAAAPADGPGSEAD
ncbi:hypothetical protein ACFYT6_29170, partial [Streptomyces vinaceus]